MSSEKWGQSEQDGTWWTPPIPTGEKGGAPIGLSNITEYSPDCGRAKTTGTRGDFLLDRRVACGEMGKGGVLGRDGCDADGRRREAT